MAQKLARMKGLSQADEKSAKWKTIAKWNRDHSESLEDFMIIAIRIAQALKDKSMTQKELAIKLGVKPQALTRIMKGRQNLSLQTIRGIEKALEISLIAVLRQEKNMGLIKGKFEEFVLRYPKSKHIVHSGTIKQYETLRTSNDIDAHLNIAS